MEDYPVYRFNFRPTFVALLSRFSILHQYDNCQDFKEAFTEWETKHRLAVEEEKAHLTSLGYVGDFRSKLYKSARYYFSRKNEDLQRELELELELELERMEEVEEGKVKMEVEEVGEALALLQGPERESTRTRPVLVLPPKKTIKKSGPRKKYTSIDSELSTKIAEYLDIEENYRMKPSQGFALFCERYREETMQEIKRLRTEEEGEEAEKEKAREAKEEENKRALLKIKKTFKNKHFTKKREMTHS